MKFTYRSMLVTAILLLAGLIAIGFTPGQTATAKQEDPNSAIYRGTMEVVHFDVSSPLKDMPSAPLDFHSTLEIFDDLPTGLEGPLGPQDVDPIVQSTVGPNVIPTPIVSFDAVPNIAGFTPPDPNGDVGPNHIVVMSNVHFAVYNKTGSVLYGPVTNNTLWSGFGGDCETDNSGDPVVLYDQFHDRWLLSQFTSSGPTYFNCVAISTSGDPTGTYYRYAVSTGTNFPDYPKYGIWSNAYYISTREFAGGTTFVGVGAYAMQISDVINGNPNPVILSFLAAPVGGGYNVGDGLLPADLDGNTLPPTNDEYYMGSMDDGAAYGAPQDALTLWKFHPDFGTPANSTFALVNTLPITNFDTQFSLCSGRSCIPQPGTSTRLDILSYRQRPIWRLAYRNFGDHESLVTNQSVEAAPGIAGNRWWEIRDPGGSPVIYQEGTYAPGVSDGIHRWMASVAMDSSGNIAMAYSASDGTSTFPSIWYTGRLASDPLGTMPQGEGSIVNGSGSQLSTGNRWGDYSSLTIDPVDDCTFWAVNEYYPTTSTAGWQLRVGAFKFDQCGTPDFTLNVTPDSQEVCKPNEAYFNVDIGQVQGYNDPVDLSTVGQPAGTTVLFSDSTVIPPGTSAMTVTNTGAATGGVYTIEVTGDAPTSTHTVSVELSLFDPISGAPNLVSPPNGAVAQPIDPTLTWGSVPEGGTYELEVATDAGFTNIVYSATGLQSTSKVVGVTLDTSTTYYWHVRKTNVCGDGSWSATFNFTTVDTPVANIEMAKTVGTDPLGCAVTDVITVSFGTDVTYCYTVTNTGDMTLHQHDLMDSELGALFTNLSYALTPGASAYYTTTENIIATTVNTATWEAYNPGGYAYDDTVPFNWVEISGTGTALNLTDDSEANVTMPFPFTFYGVTSNLVRVGNNGGILFNATTGDVAVTNATLPNSAHPLAMFPFWDDVDADTGNVYYETQGTAPNRQFIIEWYDRPHYSNTPGHTTFELILFEGTDEILFNYLDVDFQNPTYDFGASATVGINENASSALQYSYNTPSLADNFAILIAPVQPEYAAATDTATVNVITLPPTIEVSPTSLSSTQYNDTTVTQSLDISNTGDEDLDWSIFEDQGAAPAEIWSDNFDSYATGQNLHGVGGWKGWGNSAAASASTTAAQALSAPNSVDILGASDLVHEYSGSTSGQWVYTAWQYLPSSMSGQTYFILLNQYDDVGTTNNWSTQVCFDSAANVLYDATGTSCTGTNSLPIVYDQWVEIRVEIDLDADTQTFYYNNQPLFTDTWTGHVSGGGIAAIGAVDLFANNATSAYYDDLSLMPPPPPACDAPSDIPWLDVSPTSGTTVSGNTSSVDVTFDSTGLTAGTYTGNLCVTSNDIINPLVTVPVTLTVQEHTFGVVLSGNDAASGQPGTTVSYVVTITNTGDITDTFDLTADALWTTTLSDASVTLAAGETTTFSVDVDIPADALVGDSDEATITATSQGDGTSADTTLLTTSAEAMYGVALASDQAGSGMPGTVVSYQITITNTGNGPDTFDLSAADVWGATLSETSVTLNAGESASITVDVTVPSDAAEGDSDEAIITATSQGDASATASATLTTTATAPEGYYLYLPLLYK
ncbi:MAG: hypothetical protein H6636_06425 [Anaerolineales bacterium]|nr:hypothetical protein [Anaerolineales bacterium]